MLDDDTMPFHSDRPNQPWVQKCVCGKTFMQPNSYGLHVSSCKKLKERLGKTLKAARERRTGTSHVDPATVQPGSSLSTRKRKCAWLDEENLDVDNVTRPSQIVQVRR